MITLRDARISAGFSIEDAARFVNISPKALTKYEVDNRFMEFGTFLKLCRMYGVGPNSVYVGRIKMGQLWGETLGQLWNR